MTIGMSRVCACAAISCCTVRPLSVGRIRVEKDDIGRLLFENVQGRRAVLRFDDVEARETEGGAIHPTGRNGSSSTMSTRLAVSLALSAHHNSGRMN